MKLKTKIFAVLIIAASFVFSVGFDGKHIKSETKYKDAVGIELPTVSFEREIENAGSCGDALSYTLDEDGMLTITGTGNIDARAFAEVPAIKSVVISDGVTGIGSEVFMNSWNIVSVSFSSDIKTIGDRAFCTCRSLEKVDIPDGVETIGESAFSCCFGMTELKLPESIAKIGNKAFYGCVNLEKIDVSDKCKAYDSRKDCNALIDSSTNILIRGCKNTVIPNGVTGIGECAFGNIEGLSSISIPDGVKTIGEYAFCYCVDLKSVYIPNSVDSIGEDAFYNNSKGLEICAKKDSFAWKYAVDNKIILKAFDEADKPDVGKTEDVVKQTEEVGSKNTYNNIINSNVSLKKQKITAGKIKVYKAKKIKKKSLSFKLKVKASGDGTIIYKIQKKNAKYITVNKSGKVTLKKGIKKGKYKIKVIAKQTSIYNKAVKTLTVKVK